MPGPPAQKHPEFEAAAETMGLTPHEVEGWQTLLSLGPSTPSAIAKVTGRSRGHAYEFLRGLVQAGLAREMAGRPSRFAPVPVREVLQVAVAKGHERVATLSRLLGEAVGGEPDRVVPSPARSRDVSLVEGPRALAAERRRLALQATRFFCLAGGLGAARRAAKDYVLLGALQGCLARGVDVRLMVPEERTDPEGCARRLAHQLGPERVGRWPTRDEGDVEVCAN